MGMDNFTARRRSFLRRTAASVLAAAFAAVGCSGKASEQNASGATPGEAQQRKQRSERRLRSESVPINDNLPVIETLAEARLRSPQAVADRLLALTLVAVKADGLLSGESPKTVDESIARGIAQRKAGALFTPEEQAFIRTPAPEHKTQVQFIWRYEAAWVLAWALRWIDGPLDPMKDNDIPRLSEIVQGESELARRGLRPAGEILDAADLIYRYHWATREASLRPRPLPKGLTEDVVTEWHHAVNWLVGYEGQDWDEVTTDT